MTQFKSPHQLDWENIGAMDNVHHTKITTTLFDEVVLAEGVAPLTQVHRFTLSNGWMEVDVIDYGATITAIRVPDRDGKVADVALGYDDIKGYIATNNNPYFGASIGRVANRIEDGKFILNNTLYVLSKNDGENTLHGGVVGFNRKMWSSCVDREGLLMKLESPHMDQGFPGRLEVTAKFVLTEKNVLIITYMVKADQPSPVNMTNHTYFNLAGHDAGSEKLYEHNLMINANNFTPVSENLIPLGKIHDVIDTVLDFTTMKNVGEAIEDTGESNGFDHNLCVNGPCWDLKLVACLEHPQTGRRMEINSNQPGVQIYTANCTAVKEGKGKGGAGYSKHCALCLETQNYPNAINVKHFPSCEVIPPQQYFHTVSYQFSTFELPLPSPPTEVDSEGKAVVSDQPQPDDQLEQSELSPDNVETDPAPTTCLQINPATDADLCQRSLYPDFRTGPLNPDKSLEYEPLSTVEPYIGCDLDTFYYQLKQCHNIYTTTSFRFPHTEVSFKKQATDAMLDVKINTNISLSRTYIPPTPPPDSSQLEAD